MPVNTVAQPRQEQIVENQRPFARDRREQPALLQRRRPPRVERQAAADEQSQNGKDEHSARRIAGECVHRSQHPRAHQKVPISDSENARIASSMVQTLSALRFPSPPRSATARCREPRHQRRVFSTGPRTRSRPTELVIGPVRTHGDAERQAHPGASVHGRTQRAQAASMRPSISAAMANENEIEKPT